MGISAAPQQLYHADDSGHASGHAPCRRSGPGAGNDRKALPSSKYRALKRILMPGAPGRHRKPVKQIRGHRQAFPADRFLRRLRSDPADPPDRGRSSAVIREYRQTLLPEEPPSHTRALAPGRWFEFRELTPQRRSGSLRTSDASWRSREAGVYRGDLKRTSEDWSGRNGKALARARCGPQPENGWSMFPKRWNRVVLQGIPGAGARPTRTSRGSNEGDQRQADVAPCGKSRGL